MVWVACHRYWWQEEEISLLLVKYARKETNSITAGRGGDAPWMENARSRASGPSTPTDDNRSHEYKAQCSSTSV